VESITTLSNLNAIVRHINNLRRSVDNRSAERAAAAYAALCAEDSETKKERLAQIDITLKTLKSAGADFDICEADSLAINNMF